MPNKGVLQDLHWLMLLLEAVACIPETGRGDTSCKWFAWLRAAGPKPGFAL